MSGLDVARARVVLRERSVADVLDLALRFIARDGRAYALVGAGSLVPLALAALVAGRVLGWPAAWAVAVPLAIVAEIPFTVLASRLVFEDGVGAGEVLRVAARAAPRIAFARLGAAAITALAALALVVPGFWVATLFLFLPEVLLLERQGAVAAFGRAQRLASGATSEAIVAKLALALVPVASVVLADVAGRAVIGALLQLRPPRPLWDEGGSALALLGLFAQVPFLATARLFAYLDVRTRAEGWDIQTQFAALAARAEQAEPRRRESAR